MASLWSANTPRAFWQCQPDPSPDQWQQALQKAVPCLGLPVQADGIDSMLELVLGEGQFGPERWRLSPAKRLYYALKPLLPRRLKQKGPGPSCETCPGLSFVVMRDLTRIGKHRPMGTLGKVIIVVAAGERKDHLPALSLSWIAGIIAQVPAVVNGILRRLLANGF